MTRLTRKQIAEQDQYLLQRQAHFRIAADVVADALARFDEVEAITLIGSVARPLWREVPRFSEYRRARVEVWHECSDVDLAVWLTRLDQLKQLNRARNLAAQGIYEKFGFGVANHEVEVFILEPGSDRYVGRLCKFAQCPKGKIACLVPGCGSEAFLQQHTDFEFWPSTLAPGRCVPLYRRSEGILRRAADMPSVGEEAADPPPSSPSAASDASFLNRRTTR